MGILLQGNGASNGAEQSDNGGPPGGGDADGSDKTPAAGAGDDAGGGAGGAVDCAGAVGEAVEVNVHDNVFRAACFNYLRQDGMLNISSLVFSVRLDQPLGEALSTLVKVTDIYNPSPDVVSSSKDFDFDCEDEEEAPLIASAVDTNNHLFFTIQQQRLEKQGMVPGAPCVKDATLAISLATVAKFDTLRKMISILVPDSLLDLEAETFIIAPETFNCGEWMKLAKFDCSPLLDYTFTCEISSELAPVLSAVAPQLIATRATSASPFFLPRNASGNCEKLQVLHVLLENGLVHRTSDADWGSAWVLTARGAADVTIHNHLRNHSWLGKPRHGVPQEQLHVLELHHILHNSDWKYEVRKRLSDVAAYVIGEPKIWYLKPNAEKFNREYFLALLQAGVLLVFGLSPHSF